MTIDVRGPDGTIYRVNTDDENVARATVRRQLAQSQPQTPPSAAGDAIGGMIQTAPQTGYGRAYQRERRLNDLRYGYGRDTQSQRIPVLDDFLETMGHWPNTVGIADDVRGLSARAGQGVENLVRRAQGQPIQITADEAGNAAGDVENDTYNEWRRAHPGLNTASGVVGFASLLGNPQAAATRIGALQAGGGAMLIDAPFALARQEGDFQDRLPGAAREVATAGAFGAGLQGLANRFTRAPIPRRSGEPTARMRAQDFETAGVPPTLAATNQGTAAGLTKLISENFAAGGFARRNLQNSIARTGERVREMSRRYGEAAPRQDVGEMVQRGVQRFARDRNAPLPSNANARSIPVRDMSLPAKARVLYDDVFARLAQDENAMVGHVEGPIVSTDATESVLGDIMGRVSGQASREAMRNTRIEEIAQAIARDQRTGQLRFQDLREWRRWIREMQRDQGLRQSVSNADLQRLEQSLSSDIYTSAERIGGQAAQDLRRVDQWYAAGQRRIQRALQQFAPTENGKFNGPQAFQRIIDIASGGTRENTRALRSLRSTLRPDEWRVVSASVIDELGHPLPSAINGMEPDAFSLARFGTRYASLTEAGRTALFGELRPGTLRYELDALARVAKYQEGVERMANNSRSGMNAQNIATGGALLNPGLWPKLAAILGAGAVTGEMLTNPGFVRWLNSVSRSGATPGGMRNQLAALAQLAARDPALAPLYDELVQRAAQQSRSPQEQQPQRTEVLQ